MQRKFNDTGLIIRYIQQMLLETYNSNVKINGSYYETFDMNYGLAHFIAKYLDYMYPLLDVNSKQAYENNDGSVTRSINQPITIMNYFLCDNKGNRLYFEPVTEKEYKDDASGNTTYQSDIYRKIYNKYMVIWKRQEEGIPDYYYPMQGMSKYFNKIDPPLFINYTENADTYDQYTYNNNIIFPLSSWDSQKDICEIDDLVLSYLLGRTIGPRSSMEDIYYVQKLLIHDRNIEDFEKGVWCPKGYENTIHDLTQTVINYQQQLVSGSDYVINKNNIFVTGYFDIFTEACAIKEVGVRSNGIRGL